MTARRLRGLRATPSVVDQPHRSLPMAISTCWDQSGHLVDVPHSSQHWMLWHVQHLKSTSPHDASPGPSGPLGSPD
ncbi:hypothetical protein ONE63_008526 [Megalurothrips usitatus]|uniref:Uncharacterized protein n=1 Tax=Megalurothrips usitatus TaxID=439358 RepID=A0AAV7XU29_9NEOP|nr:hypothetical protein ONE63_008526 [Megalurothrips usitatus]